MVRNLDSDTKKPSNFFAILPSLIFLSLLFANWILFFKRYLLFSSFVFFAPLLFVPICIISAIYQLIRKNLRNFVILIFPLVLFFSFECTTFHAIERHSRYHAEFLIQKYIYNSEIADISNGKTNGITYKEWSFPSGAPNVNYWIIYDATDEVMKKNGIKTPIPVGDTKYTDDCEVYKLEGHFYMMSMFYGDMVWY